MYTIYQTVYKVSLILTLTKIQEQNAIMKYYYNTSLPIAMYLRKQLH